MQLTVLPTSEDERRSLQRRFGARAVENGAYLVVDANQDEMKELLAEKILFNHHDEKPEESAEPALPGPTTAGASLESSDDEAQAPTEIAVVRGPMTAARQQWLASEGVKLVQRMGSGRYVVSGESAAIRSAESKSDWLSLRDYGVVETIGTKVAASVAATLTPGASLEDTDAVDAFSDEAGTEADPAMYDVRCFDNGRLASLRAQLEVDPRVDSVESGSNRLRYYVSKGADAEAALLLDLGRDSTIEIVERYIPPEPALEYARAALIGLSAPASWNVPWRGKGETIGFADSGIDAEHPDFEGRLKVVLREQPASPRDPIGHGTHVASIAAGDGKGSGGKLAGVAPEAKLFVQSIADQTLRYRFGVGLTDMLTEAYASGVRVQNYSWGAPRVEGRYTLDALDIDAFVYDHPDMLVVIAAGNAGQQDPADPAGRNKLRSLASPASSKNALAVGSCCSPRTDGPYAGLTWSRYDGSNPPQKPAMSGLPLTGNADIVAPLSSSGPSDDGRVKPDLVAPGVGIAAAKSADSAAARHPYPPKSDLYQYMSGTSMATPMVAGAAAIVRQYYREVHAHEASAALLKATLINGTEWLDNASFVDDNIGAPNFHQGYGRLNVARAIPLDGGAAGFELRFVDIDNKGAGALLAGDATRARHLLKVTLTKAGPLSVTMAWTDPPARHIQHNLDLVLIGPDGSKVVGNAQLKRLPFDTFDRSNNVEQSRVPNAEAGEWMISVTAQNTFRGSQGFALAVTGPL